MKRIILAGNGAPLEQAYKLLKNDFNIVGVIKDYERENKTEEEFDEFLKSKQVLKFKLVDLVTMKIDLLFVVNFNKIIKEEFIKDIFTLNLHIGLLPKYRGNNANAWAILNGEREVGYTIHEVTPILDGGDIFYKFKYTIKDTETYYHAKIAMNNDIDNNLSQTLLNILDDKIERVSQIGYEFVYTCRLNPLDGFIKTWNISNYEIIQKNIIFAKPLGTGLKFLFKENIYEINKLSTIPFFANSKGINGAVIMKLKTGSIWIKTSDNAISIDELNLDGKIILPSEIFKIGDRL